MKTISFIPELLNDDYSNLYLKLLLVGAAWVIVLVAMSIDLYFGIQKSKQINDFITSEGYRRSIQKFTYYYSMMVFALLFDCILSIVVYYLPFPLNLTPVVTMLACLALVLTELKSVREKAEDKLRRRTDSSFKQLVEALKDKDLLSRLFDQLAKEKETPSE